MKVIGFDLSTTCVGVCLAEVNSSFEFTSMRTLPIKPPKYKSDKYLPSKVNMVSSRGNKYKSFVKFAGEAVTVTEAKKRSAEVHQKQETHKLQYMSKGINDIIDEFKPDVIVMENNMGFRSQQATKVLGEVAGALQAIATVKGIPLVKYNVNTARAVHSSKEVMANYVGNTTPLQRKREKDVTKAAFRHHMCKMYENILDPSNIAAMGTDESDAIVVVEYWRRDQRG